MITNSFESVGDLFDQIQKDRQAADDRVELWQEKIQVGDFFVRLANCMGTPIMVFGEVVESQYEEDRESYARPHMKHFRLTKSFSVLCSEGEFGDVHVSTIDSVITKGMFEAARNCDFSSGIILEWMNKGWVPDKWKEEAL